MSLQESVEWILCKVEKSIPNSVGFRIRTERISAQSLKKEESGYLSFLNNEGS